MKYEFDNAYEININQIQEIENTLWLHDVEIGKGGDRNLKMEIVLPKERSAEAIPAVVYIHGGAWDHGNKDDHLTKLIRIANRGYVAVAVEYRFSQEAVFPAQIEDCKLAIRYLRGRAKIYNIDQERIGVWGTSAGGYLAALLGTTIGITELEGTGGWQDYSSEVNLVVDWCGPANFLAKGINEHIAVTKLLGVSPSVDKEMAAKAMPISYISHKTPPFLIIHGDNDPVVPYTQSITLYEYLKDKGIKVTLKIFEGEGHSFNITEPYNITMEFLDKNLK